MTTVEDVLRILKEAYESLTAREIHARLAPHYEPVTMTALYRALNTLARRGFIERMRSTMAERHARLAAIQANPGTDIGDAGAMRYRVRVPTPFPAPKD